MKPSVRIFCQDSDITVQINRRILEINLTDSAGFANDRVQLVFDDRPPYIKIPEIGTPLKILMGYETKLNHFKPSKLRFMGVFYIDEFEFQKGSGGRKFAINAHAADTELTWKEPRGDEDMDSTIGEAVRKRALRNKMKYKLEKGLGDTPLQYENQTHISDMSYLDGLALKHGCKVKVLDNTIFFGKAEKLPELMAVVLPDVTIDDEEILDYRFLTQGRGRYSAVRAYYHDKDNGEHPFVISDKRPQGADEYSEEVYYTLPRTYPTKDEAKAAAEAKKNALDKSQASISLTIVGNSEVMAETSITLENFRPGVIAEWEVQKVVHKFDSSGFTSAITAENWFKRRRRRRNRNQRIQPII